jgi:hypothetical protein
MSISNFRNCITNNNFGEVVFNIRFYVEIDKYKNFVNGMCVKSLVDIDREVKLSATITGVFKLNKNQIYKIEKIRLYQEEDRTFIKINGLYYDSSFLKPMTRKQKLERILK